MILQENPAAARAMIETAKAAQDAAHPRAEGLHVSDLVYCLRKSWYQRNGYIGPSNPQDDVILLMGQGHHGLIQNCSGIAVELPVELELAGVTVHGTVDLVQAGPLPVEIKTTRSSAKKDVASQSAHYIEQLASYVLALGVTRGRLAIWHLNGDYSKGPASNPQLRVWDVEFERVELASWKRELTRRVIELEDGRPFLPAHYGWECKYCPFHEDKGGPCAGGPGRELPFFAQDNLPAWAVGE